MADVGQIREHMEVVGADGVRLGTVDQVKGDRIKLTRASSGQGQHEGHHHFLPTGLVAAVEGNQVRLSANADVARNLFEDEENRQPLNAQSGGTQQFSTQQSSTTQQSTTTHKPEVHVSSEKPVWNWNRLGLGAAATLGVAAVAGAALLSRRNREDEDDFELRLETDETVRLIASDKVEGTKVVDRDGATLGTIKSFMVDKYTGRVAYAIMTFGGTMGLGSSYFPLPWPLLDYDVDKDGYALDITKAEMAQAPRFEANDQPEFTPEYRRTVISFYRPQAANA